jgi:hypothetical protein
MNTNTVDKDSTKQRCSRKLKSKTTESKEPSQNSQNRKQKYSQTAIYRYFFGYYLFTQFTK